MRFRASLLSFASRCRRAGSPTIDGVKFVKFVGSRDIRELEARVTGPAERGVSEAEPSPPTVRPRHRDKGCEKLWTEEVASAVP